jgi:hypothetical protein
VRGRLWVALFVVLMAAPVPGSAAGAAERPLRPALRVAAAQVDWTNLTVDERRRVLRRWNHAPRLFDALVERVAARTSIGRSEGDAIAQGNFTESLLDEGDESASTWQISLSPTVLDTGSRLNAHLTLHELGHVIDGVLADEDWREAFMATLAHSPAWQQCWPMPPGSSSRCVRSNELIADQFAFWATGHRTTRSSYTDPPLLPRATLGSWFARLIPRWARDQTSYTTN